MIGIISYNIHSVHMNYGAALHSWAFQQYLNRLGRDSVVINYFPASFKRHGLSYSIKYPFLNYKRFWNIPHLIYHITNWLVLGYFPNLRKYKKFSRFFNERMKKTQREYSQKELTSTSDIESLEIDTFVAESDVIWKLSGKGSFDEVFFLQFPSAEGKRKVAYAPSLSSRQFTLDEEVKFRELVSDFTAISTRERQGAEYLTRILKKEVDWMLDPTLLLDECDYLPIIQLPQERDYILLYNCMINDQLMVKEAEAYAQRKGKKLIELSNWNINKLQNNHQVITDAGIEEFLGYFKNASEVICNAFHGVCFSVIFKKPFCVFQRDNSDYRMKNITEELGLSLRFVPYDNKHLPLVDNQIDYNEVYKTLYKHRQRSYKYIEDYIL